MEFGLVWKYKEEETSISRENVERADAADVHESVRSPATCHLPPKVTC